MSDMVTLHSLKNTSKPAKARKRVGRGIGSKTGKTCGRGEKGAGSRAGSKLRLGKEGGNVPLFMKVPLRGFSNFRFRREYDIINLDQINNAFQDGETVDISSMRKKGLLSGPTHGVKILGNGDLTKNVTCNVQALSNTAREKLTRAKIHFTISPANNNP